MPVTALLRPLHAYKVAFEAYPELFRDADDEIWRRWVDAKRNRRQADLVEILAGDFAEPFKARALAVLLSPNPSWTPIYWANSSGTFWVPKPDSNWVANLPPSFIGLYRTLVFVLADANATPEITKVVNWHLRQIMAMEGDTVPAVLRYQINSPSTQFEAYEDAMTDPAIPGEAKASLDYQMRSLALSEAKGEFTPRVDHESPFRRYFFFVQRAAIGELNYSVEILARQVRFVLAQTALKPKYAYAQWVVAGLYERFEEPRYDNLRFALAQHGIERNAGTMDEFRVIDEQSMLVAQKMQVEFGTTELAPKLSSIVEVGVAMLADRQSKAAKHDLELAESLDAMRISS